LTCGKLQVEQMAPRLPWLKTWAKEPRWFMPNPFDP